MANVDFYFTAKVKEDIRDEILEADGQEVFFVCAQDDDGVIYHAEPLARGNSYSVSALFQTAKPGNVIVHNHPSGNLSPSDADVTCASQFGNDGIGSIIVNNDVSDCYVVVEPFAPHKAEALDLDKVAEIFDENGVLAKKLDSFEKRDSQIEMARKVANAYNQEKILMIEAGTGTGKSLAYLIPSIMWAVANKEKVVISTNTINLQEQLINKDIPFLKEHTPYEYSAVLIKGRSNYLCKKKIAELSSYQQQDLFDKKELKQEKDIIKWSNKTTEGSLSELSFIPGHDLWEKFCSEQDVCMKIKCPNYNDCFYYMARRRAAHADIIVANHHLLFADISAKQDMPDSMGAILPAFKHVVIDEAHNIEDIASTYFGFTVSRMGLIKLLGRLQHSRYRGRGVLPEMVAKLMPLGKTQDTQALLQKLIDEINDKLIPDRNKLMIKINNYFDELEKTIIVLSTQYSKDKNSYSLRIKEEIRQSEEWGAIVKPKMSTLKKDIVAFNKKLKEVFRWGDLFDEDIKKVMEFSFVTLRAMIRRLEEYSKKIALLMEEDKDNQIAWFEWSKKAGYLNCKVMPLEVAPLLADKLYKNHKSVVLTSATFTIEKKFDFFEQRIGLNLMPQNNRDYVRLKSPFNYDEQVLFSIPSDMPEPMASKFNDELPDTIHDLVMLSHGKAFILFTSYYMLDKVYNQLANKFEDEGITPLKQGSMNRHHLLEQFKQDTNSCLFATDSFWEGVDVVGESLSNIIITRLPFRVPTDPLHEARAELLKKKGYDPFSDYAVPLAILKFRQGIGRLIRHKTDRGVISVLDSRIITKNYGRKFMRSLFVKKPIIQSKEIIYKRIKDFF